MNRCAKLMACVNSDIRGKNFFTALELEKRGEKILKLNTGNPAAFGFEMPESVKNALIENMDLAVGYCDVRGMVPARQAIMQYHLSKNIRSFSLDDIFIGNGVSEIATMVTTALLNPGDEVLLPTPCYSLWENEVRLRQAKPVFYRCDESQNWQPDTEHIQSLITPKTKAIVIINPNNPTGVLYENRVLLEIAQIAREHKLVVLCDEIYDRLVFPGKTHTSFAALADDLTVITMNGLSKSHSICGFRCGWLVTSGPAEERNAIGQALLKIASMRLSANALMQTVIPAALADTQYTEAMIVPGGRLYEQRKATLEELSKLSCISCVKNDAAFYVFPKIKEEYIAFADDKAFTERLLLDKHILVVPGSGFSWAKPNYFRIVMLPQAAELRQAVQQIGAFIYEQKA